jgi:hypothetical protein
MEMTDRKEMQARYHLFDEFALKDQKRYYERTIEKNRKSAAQVNFYRAIFALLTGLFAALAGIITATTSEDSSWIYIAGACAVLAVVLPALGGAFSTLADLYQWDKLNTIFESALENMEVADALSPSEKIIDDVVFRASTRAYAEGALTVMSDETAQWGQSIRTPSQIESFVAEERAKVERLLDADMDTTDTGSTEP